MSAERPENRIQPTSVAVRLAVAAERPDLPPGLRGELLSMAFSLREGVCQLGDGRIAFTSGALSTALGLTSRGHLAKWRASGEGPRAVALRHGQKTTWMYPADGVREWLSEVALDPRSRPSSKLLDQLAALGMVEIINPVREAA